MEIQAILDILTNAGVLGALVLLMWKRLGALTDNYAHRLEELQQCHKEDILSLYRQFSSDRRRNEQELREVIEKNIEMMTRFETLFSQFLMYERKKTERINPSESC